MLRPSTASSQIRSMLTSICLRRPKTSINLPTRNNEIHWVKFSAEEAAHYNDMNEVISVSIQHGLNHGHLGAYSTILTKINSLRQICNLGTQYKRTLLTSQQDRETAMQETFDEMIAAGVAICSRCEKDLGQEDPNEPMRGDVDYGRPMLSACRELICASCLSPEATGRNTLGCKHRPFCKFSHVDITSSGHISADHRSSEFPVKLKALQRDVQAMPNEDKWSVPHFLSLLVLHNR